MADLDKVISALDCLANGGGTYDCLKFPCPYGFYGYTDCRKWEIARDALELLKEQEAVEPKKENDGNPEPWTAWWYVCGDCGQPIDKVDRYCRGCGKQVKWE